MSIKLSPSHSRRAHGGFFVRLLCALCAYAAASSDSVTFGDLKAELLDEGDAETSDFGESVLNPVTEDDVKRSLQGFVGGSADATHEAKLTEFQSALRPMFAALPKDDYNLLAYQTAFYAIHRFLMDSRGWFIRGLEPSDAQTIHNQSMISSEWVPGYILGLLSERSGKFGASLYDLSVMVAILEELIHTEMAKKLEAVYTYLGLPTSEPVGKVNVSCAFEAFLYYVLTFDHVQARVRIDPFGHGKESPSQRRESMCGVQLTHLSTDKISDLYAWVYTKLNTMLSHNEQDAVTFAQAKSFAYTVADEYQQFNDADCSDLKSGLLAMEGKDGATKPGRISVATYHSTGSYKYWIFGESVENLRIASILDESDGVPTIVVPNILASRFNCVESSSLYAICCKVECDALLTQIELSLAAAGGTARQIAAFISQLRSSTGPPPELSPELLAKLQQLEDAHGGLVPIYSEAFSMWLHRVYPRECPQPHPEHGSTFPMTAGEWLHGTSTAWTEESHTEAPVAVSSTSGNAATYLLLLFSFFSAVAWYYLQKHQREILWEAKCGEGYGKDCGGYKKLIYTLFGSERNITIVRQLLVVLGIGSAGIFCMTADVGFFGILFMCLSYLVSRMKMQKRSETSGGTYSGSCKEEELDCGKYI